MANMSYVRFENTYKDLEDCHEALESKPFYELSESEQLYAKYLIELCGRISNEFDYLITD